jgi:signal transduction histidine kinase
MAHPKTGSRHHLPLANAASPEVAAARRDERARIARDVHDDIGGNLIAVKMALAMLVRALPADSAGLLDKAKYVDELVDRTIESVHQLAVDLAPESLQLGLCAAIAWHAAEFTRQAGVPCEVAADDASIDRDMSAEQASTLLRIYVEALTNIGKHAQAARVKVHLERSGNIVRLQIADDGKGMQPADCSKARSLGVRGMLARAQALGGDVTFQPAAPHGTMVIVTLPLKEDNA